MVPLVAVRYVHTFATRKSCVSDVMLSVSSDCFHKVFSLLDPKTIKMFHFSGVKHTTPNCPIQLSPDFNPSAGANFDDGGAQCKKNARYNVPFFSARPGPKYEEWSTNAHEGRPGHHTQVSVCEGCRHTANQPISQSVSQSVSPQAGRRSASQLHS